MKIISLLQPWATLVVIGAKKIETRSWNTKYRGPVLIHASARMNKGQKEMTFSEPFATALKGIEELPLGRIVGMANLKTTFDTTSFVYAMNLGLAVPGYDGSWETESHFGDYSAGRFGWRLSDPVSFLNHIPWKGQLGVRDFDHMICHACGCMEHDCRACIESTGKPCYWVAETMCSACYHEQDEPICESCGGSCEGPGPGTTCRTCKGRGSIKLKKEESI